MNGLVALFLEVIVLAIILLMVRLAALGVLVVAARVIVVLIVLMMIIRLAIVTIAFVTLMVVGILVARMLLVAQFTATSGRELSCFLFFRLLLILGNLLKNANCLVSCLTLLKESNEFERVSRHCLVQVCKLELILGLRDEDLFTLLLHPGYFNCLTEVATLEIAEKLYLTPN